MPTINRKHHEFDLMVSAGSITDHRATNIFGFNEAVGTDYIPLWENAAAYVYPGSALTMTAVSDSASDVAVIMIVQGLDINYDEIQASFTLNGTNAVTIGTAFYRINNVITTGGAHAPQEVSGSVALTSGQYNAVRIQFGEQSGGDLLEFNYSTPTIVKTTNVTGKVFYNPATNGH